MNQSRIVFRHVAPHRSSTFGIQYGNTGNVNVYDVLLLVHLPKGVAVTGLDGAVVPPGVQPAPGLDGVSVQTDTETLVPIWFYVLPAGVSRTISFAINLQDRVGVPGSFEIKAELLLPPPFEAEFSRTGDFATLPSYFGPSHKKNPFYLALLALNLAKAERIRQRVLQLIQGELSGGLAGSKAERLAELSQSDPAFKSGSALANFATPEQGGITNPLDKSDDYLNTFNPSGPDYNTGGKFNDALHNGTFQGALDTGPIPFPYAYAGGIVLTILAGAAVVAGSPLAVPALIASGAFGILGIISTGNSAQAAVAKYQVHVAASLDPNELVGSPGAGIQRYISGQEPLRYAIYFENKPEASAPAQTVVVTDQLDISKMDLSTFSLGVIRLGGTNTVTPPFGQKTFSTDVDLRPAKNIIVRINAGLNSSTGLVTWTFKSIDPTTGLPPEDVLAGFLPPNINGTDGEGSVVFTVQPKDLPTGAEARNKARIVFDQNAPIDTNEWLNTIDNSKPVSRVAALNASQPSIIFNVKWAGTDTGSGINTYTVYVSENGGAFTIWQNATTDTSGLFAGLPGRTYSFYSVARDKANNAEAAKTVAEATTTVVSSSLQNSIDDPRFFVRQQYLDFLNREPDTGGFDYWTSLITSCPNGDTKCVNSKRVTVSAAFFIEQEFQDTGSFVYRFYKGSLGRPPAYDEFVSDRSRVIGGTSLEVSKATFAGAWTQRPEFLDKYPATLSAAQFVDALLQTVKQTSTVDLTGSRQTFINQLQATGGTRGQVIRAVVDAQAFQKAEYNRAFVLMQYFGYLRRDPDTAGYNFWLDILNNRVANNYRSMVCAFITSAEYQLRFGSTVTRTDAVCGSIGQ